MMIPKITARMILTGIARLIITGAILLGIALLALIGALRILLIEWPRIACQRVRAWWRGLHP